MIETYKKENLKRLLFVLALCTLSFFMDQFSDHIFWWTLGTLAIGYFLYDIFYKLLLVDVVFTDKLIRITFYSIIFKQEELQIELNDFIDVESNHTNQINIFVEGKNGPIKKTFYNNSSPWHELSQKLKKLKSLARAK